MMMSPRLRKWICILSGILIVACLLWLIAYSLIRRVPEFYSAAMDRKTDIDTVWADEFVKVFTALAGDIERPGRWQATFTADQINGWLATDQPRDFPDILPHDLHDPRVQIARQRAMIGLRVGPVDAMTVYSFEFDAYRVDDNTFALKIQAPYAGSLRLSTARVQRELTDSAKKNSIPLEWRNDGGAPVALIRLDSLWRDERTALRLESLEIRDGALFLAGETVRLGRQ